jgi:AraC family transcriptional regulator
MDSNIDTLLRGSRLVGTSSGDLWRGIRVERRIVDPFEREENEIDSHFAILWGGEPTIAEREYRKGRFQRVIKRPGSLSLGSAGRLPAVRPLTAYDVTVVAIDTSFAQTVVDGFEDSSAYRLHEQLGIQDKALRRLIGLLALEAKSGGESGSLYQQSLEQAFVARFLFAGRSEGTSRTIVSPLPGNSLRRLLDRIESEYERNLTLDELADEVGYSRSHFQKMFRQATGKSVFAYLRDIRLEKARAALLETDEGIAEIANAVGFSSHAHLTKLFVGKFGIAPSRYRRDR